MAKKNIQDKMNERFRVRVFKPQPGFDDRHKLCGEKMQKDIKDGQERHFFEIPAHLADYVNQSFRHYRVSDPFIPGVDDVALVGLMEKPKPEGAEEDEGKQ